MRPHTASTTCLTGAALIANMPTFFSVRRKAAMLVLDHACRRLETDAMGRRTGTDYTWTLPFIYAKSELYQALRCCL
jgi:hypothetical protein